MENNDKPRLTVGITVHSYMNPELFRNCLKSHLYSYEYNSIKEPVNIIISIDTCTEEDTLKKFEKKSEVFLSELNLEQKEYVKKIEKIIEINKREIEILNREREKFIENIEDRKREHLDIFTQVYGIDSKDIMEKDEQYKKRLEFYEKEKTEGLEFFDKQREKYEEEIKNIERDSNEYFGFYNKYIKGTKEYEIEKERMLEELKYFKKEHEIIIKEFKEKFKEINPRVKINTIESTRNFGRVSAMRNAMLLLACTPKITFCDGDDKIINEMHGLMIDELNNDNQERDDIRYRNSSIYNPDVISFLKEESKTPSGKMYNRLAFTLKKVKFPKGTGCEDGIFKAFLRIVGLEEGYAISTVDSTINNYQPSNSTIVEVEKEFESILQIVYCLYKLNAKMNIRNSFSGLDVSDYNNFFQLFNSGYRCNGYGFSFGSSSKNNYSIDLSNKKYGDQYVINVKKSLSYVIASLILYPEVLEDGKEKNYFMKVNKILKNKKEDLSILKVMQETEGYKEVFDEIKKNFEQPELFEEYIKDFDLYINEKKEVFEKMLRNTEKNKNPHLTGDTSNIPLKIDFEDYFSVESLKNNRIEYERIELMNKLLNGKYIPKKFDNLDPDIRENLENNKTDRRKFMVQYLFDSTEEKDREFVLDIIKKTKKYSKDNSKIREFVDKCFNGNEVSEVRIKQEKTINKDVKIRQNNVKDQLDEEKKELKTKKYTLDTIIGNENFGLSQGTIVCRSSNS